MSSLGMEGRWIVYAAMAGAKVKEANFTPLILKRGRIIVSTLRSRTDDYKARLVKRFEQEALPDFDTGKIKPVVDRVMKLSQIVEAHSYIEQNKNVGKVVLINDL